MCSTYSALPPVPRDESSRIVSINCSSTEIVCAGSHNLFLALEVYIQQRDIVGHRK